MVCPVSAPTYLDPKAPLDARVNDLLGRMTLPEKVGQLLQLDGRSDTASEVVLRFTPGSLLNILNERLEQVLLAVEQTRLKIPLLIGQDAIHGHSFQRGATIFPTQLAMACSFDTQLLRASARATAREVSTTGAHWTFSPVFCIARDLRWGRVNETFGEDPFLIGELGAAMVEGYQGDGLSDPESILATAKHYAGYSETQGGHDASEADLSPRKLRSYFLPPFERAARAGCRTFMTGYQSMEGVPSTANRWLLTEVLREEWGFQGIVVTDYDNVGRLVWGQRIAPSDVEAAVIAVRCGNDMMMASPDFYAGCLEAVARGMLAEAEVDTVVRRILRLKFELGLFENVRRPDRERQAKIIGCPEHRELALRAARESVVLLKNDGLLPLNRAKLGSIAVFGKNADDDIAQLGDWSLGTTQYPEAEGKHPRECTVTILDGIRALGQGVAVEYAAVASPDDKTPPDLARVRELANGSDLNVVVVGDSIALTGERQSTATLELMGGQKALLDAVAAAGKPFVVVLVNGKPLVLPPAAHAANAIVECFNPGMLGGRALGELLFGELNPSGKLPITFPRHVGQAPVYYNHIRMRHGQYADIEPTPAFAFGYGLSFTRYEYGALRLSSAKLRDGEALRFEVEIANVGGRDGVEIVQVYSNDLVTSVTWPARVLVAFARVELAAGERKSVSFEIPFERFSLLDAYGKRVVEPGEFELSVGGSSRDEDLVHARFHVEGEAFSLSRIPGL
jgi:beta-glucosidase